MPMPKMPMPPMDDSEPDAGPDEPLEQDDLEQRVSALEDAVFGSQGEGKGPMPAPPPAPSMPPPRGGKNSAFYGG